MLNSKDKFVQHLKDHFSNLGVGIELSNNKLIIRDNLMNINIALHIFIGLLLIKFTPAINDSLYISPLFFLYSALLYVILWVDYKSINIIEFDLLNKHFSITNRSVVRRLVAKYLIPQPVKYYFEEIAGVEETEKQVLSFPPVKHFVNLRLKNGQGLELISFSDKMNAMLFSQFISIVLK